jgi:hypothetical protein
MPMSKDALFEQASPACRECRELVRRVEHSWHTDEDGVWRLRGFMVCASGHRALVGLLGLMSASVNSLPAPNATMSHDVTPRIRR